MREGQKTKQWFCRKMEIRRNKMKKLNLDNNINDIGNNNSHNNNNSNNNVHSNFR